MTWVAPRRRPTRDTILFGLGLLILIWQAIEWRISRQVEPAFITAGTTIFFSPLLLHKDEQKQTKSQPNPLSQAFLEELEAWMKATKQRDQDSGPEP